jgi:6-phosphogluconolactonase
MLNFGVSILLMAATGIAGSLRAESHHVFMGTGGPAARGVYRAGFDAKTGRLGPASLAAAIGSPGFLALHPDGDKLYSVGDVEGGPGVAGYRVSPAGDLERITAGPTGGGAGCHLAVHPSGRFLLTAQYGGGSVALFPLDGGGRLGPAVLTRHEGPGSGVVADRQKEPHPHWCGFSPDHRFALVPDLGLDGIMVYRVDTDEPSITRHGFLPAPPGSGPRHMRFSPDGRHIYLLNELSLAVSAYAWDAGTGTARLLATTPTLDEQAKAGESFNSAAEILVHPTGRFLYTSNRGHDSVSVFRADPETAALAVVQVQPVRGAFPRNINLSPCGGWLLAAGADSHTVSVHRVDPDTGRLTYQLRGVIQTPSPICLLFVPRQ